MINIIFITENKPDFYTINNKGHESSFDIIL